MTAPELAQLAARVFASDPHRFGGIVVRSRAGPARDGFLQRLRGFLGAERPWRRIPVGIDDDSLMGGLDLAAALRLGRAQIRRGLLAEVDGGIAIVASAERLSASIAGRLGAALDSGGYALERDGASRRYESRFGCVFLDEGEGEERTPPALGERAAFQVDLAALRACDLQGGDVSLSAKGPLHEDDGVMALTVVAAACGVDSSRAVLFGTHTARTIAALDGRANVFESDVALAASLVLSHRALRAPEMVEGDPPPQAEADCDSEDDSPREDVSPAMSDVIVAAVRAAAPADLLASLAQGRILSKSDGNGAQNKGGLRGRPLPSLRGLPRGGRRLALLDTVRAAAPWQRLRAGDQWAKDGRLQFERTDLRIKHFKQRSDSTVLFLVDASGSTAFQRLAEVKGAIEALLSEAYVTRTQVGLIAFRENQAEVLAPPTRSLARARKLLTGLPGGGATPLAAGLDCGLALALGERARGRSVVTLVLSDGRANVARDGGRDRSLAVQDAHAAARRYRSAGVHAVFVDTGRWPSPDAAAIAASMGARYAPLPFADAAAMAGMVRQ